MSIIKRSFQKIQIAVRTLLAKISIFFCSIDIIRVIVWWLEEKDEKCGLDAYNYSHSSFIFIGYFSHSNMIPLKFLFFYFSSLFFPFFYSFVALSDKMEIFWIFFKNFFLESFFILIYFYNFFCSFFVHSTMR